MDFLDCMMVAELKSALRDERESKQTRRFAAKRRRAVRVARDQQELGSKGKAVSRDCD